MDMVEKYQTTRHSTYCSYDPACITHCITLALSGPNCAEQYPKCNHVHANICCDCINVILTLDEIEGKIEQIFDKDVQVEVKYDFQNVSENIIEWSGHNLRAAQ